MKRSFYEMLGINRDAEQAQIDTAYALATARLNAVNLRGVAEAVTEARLIRDGYQILSSPDRRANYDAQLLADEIGLQTALVSSGESVRRAPVFAYAVFAALAAALGAILYHHMSAKMDEVQVQHVQAVERHKEEQRKVIVIDTIHASPAMANAAGDAQKR